MRFDLFGYNKKIKIEQYYKSRDLNLYFYLTYKNLSILFDK